MRNDSDRILKGALGLVSLQVLLGKALILSYCGTAALIAYKEKLRKGKAAASEAAETRVIIKETQCQNEEDSDLGASTVSARQDIISGRKGRHCAFCQSAGDSEVSCILHLVNPEDNQLNFESNFFTAEAAISGYFERCYLCQDLALNFRHELNSPGLTHKID